MAAEECRKAVEEGLQAAVEWSKACGVVSKSAEEVLNASREGLTGVREVRNDRCVIGLFSICGIPY